MDTWELVDAERKDSVALLESLEPQQWEVQSLCTGWKVRDVAAHLSSPANWQVLPFAVELLRSGMNFNKATQRDAIRRAKRDTKEIVDEYRGTIGKRRKPPGTVPATVLNDMVVHAQDIRRPLGISRQIPEDRVRTCLDYVKNVGIPFGTKKRIAGVKLVATDIGWTHGDGPEVRGTAEALLMMMNGRKDALKDLDGEGKATLESRMA
jgi:uncharacterized protein (TIGR03083 family)